jgi:hypothetical protein
VQSFTSEMANWRKSIACPSIPALLIRRLVAAAVVAAMLPGAFLQAEDKPAHAEPQTANSSDQPYDAAREAAKQTERMKVQLERIRLQLDRLMSERNKLRHERAQIAEDIFAKCGLSPENVKPVMLELERERFMLQTALETKPAHLRALSEDMAAIAAQAQERAKADRVRESLEKILDERRRLAEIKQAQAKAAVATPDEATRAQAEQAEAEMQLALRKEEIAKAAGNGELERLSRELRELTVERSLDDVRLHTLEGKLKTLRSVLGAVDDYNDMNERILTLGREIEKMESFLLQAGL